MKDLRKLEKLNLCDQHAYYGYKLYFVVEVSVQFPSVEIFLSNVQKVS